MKNFVKSSKALATIMQILRAKTICKQESYYPDEPHKSTWQVFCDQLFFIWTGISLFFVWV